VVNAGLLGLVCGLLALVRVWVLIPPLAVAGAAAIWLRGYLVPYTPTFAPKLVGVLPGDPFHATDGGRPAGADAEVGSLSGSGDAVDGEVVVESLLEAGVVTADGEDLDLSDEARERWRSAMGSFRELEPAELAARLRALSDAPAVEPTTQETGVWFLLRDASDAFENEVFLSRPVVVAELAAAEMLDGVVEDPAVRRQAVEPLRMFLRECPTCEAALIETDTLDCCGATLDKHSEPAPVLACPECDRRLYTFPA